MGLPSPASTSPRVGASCLDFLLVDRSPGLEAKCQVEMDPKDQGLFPQLHPPELGLVCLSAHDLGRSCSKAQALVTLGPSPASPSL